MIDPTHELLWKKVGEAYSQMVTNKERGISFEHEKYRVALEHIANDTGVMIRIWDDVKPEPPTLIAP
jgi:hypothetical protein